MQEKLELALQTEGVMNEGSRIRVFQRGGHII
jgi:hypothetical protein